jgi:PAS domain S-box-containing protein
MAASSDPTSAYQEVFDNLPGLAWITAADGRVETLNARAHEYFGANAEMILQGNFVDIVHPDDREETVARWTAASTEKTPFEMELRLLRGDGRYCWHLARATPVEGPDGAPRRWVGTSTNIDPQRRAADALRFLAEASVILSSSLDHTETLASIAKLAVPKLADWCAVDLLRDSGSIERVAVVHVDPTKVELGWELWRRNPPTLDDPSGVGRVLRTGEPEVFREVTADVIRNVVTDPALVDILLRLNLRSSIAVPLVARGKVHGALTLVAAESERLFTDADVELATEIARRASGAIENSLLYREAQEALRTRENLLAIVSQDLKSPLNTVYNDVGILLRTITPETRIDRARLDSIRLSIERMQSFLNSYLDLEEIRAGKLVLDKSSQDATALLLEALEVNRPLIAEKGLMVMRDLAPRLSLHGDKKRLVQVLSRMIASAIRSSPRGGKLVLHALADREGVRYSIVDSGPARSAEELEQLVGSTTATSSNLSFAISRAIVEAHGGRMWVESHPPESGTAVNFLLPIG